MTCKKCKWYLDCAIFACGLDDSGVEITDEIAEHICQTMRLGFKENHKCQ